MIAGCVLTSAILLIAQFYFLHNTYLLYQKQALSEIRNELAAIERKINIDSLRSDRIDRIQKAILSGTKEDIKNQVSIFADSFVSGRVTQLVASNNLLKKHRVKYIAEIKQAIIRYEDPPRQFILLNNKFWFGNSFGLTDQSKLTQYTLTRILKSGSGAPVFCELQTESSFDVGSWQNLLFSKLIGVILFLSLLTLGVIALFYVTIRNIIKQKRISDIKTDFVNNITHEFNTPLTTLDIAVATLEKLKNNFSSDALNAISTIERQSKRLNSLVKQAIEFSKAGEEIQIQKSSVDIAGFISNLVSDFRRSHPDVKMNLKQMPVSANLAIDPFMIATAINNLMDNAVKYGGKNLEVQTSSKGANYSIRIQDDGIGIPASSQKMIFDKFYRVESGETHNVKGLGLGLYYARQIVEAHVGKIDVQSIVGEGSKFTILIPTR